MGSRLTEASGDRSIAPGSTSAEDYEVRYWSGKFGCTHDELKAAVRKVGVMEKDVEAELRRRKGP